MTALWIGPTSSESSLVAMPDLANGGLNWSMQDVDYDTGRTADGTMVRNRVARKRKITATWPPMVPADVSTVLQAISAEHFYVKAFDFEAGEYAVMKMYAGDRTIPYINDTLGEVASVDPYNGEVTMTGLCDSFSVGLVEF